MITKQERLSKDLSKGKSIGFWAIGYYLNHGNQFSPTIKTPIFDVNEQSKTNTMVLIDYLGSMMWINCKPEWVFYGMGGEFPPSKEGKLLRFQLESLKQ